MNVELVYVHVAGSIEHQCETERFAASYSQHPPGCDHSTTVIVNGGTAKAEVRALFGRFPNCRFYQHDNVGQDIGGYIAVSSRSTADMCVYLGSSTHFWRDGWLGRMAEAWTLHGPGLYGAHTSFQVRPHFHTTAIWCSPSLMAGYAWPVRERVDRYDFEHGAVHPERMFWRTALLAGWPVKMVTWDGEYDWWDWRRPANIMRRGDQSNLLTLWKHADLWYATEPSMRGFVMSIADTLTDRTFDLASHRFLTDGSTAPPQVIAKGSEC